MKLAQYGLVCGWAAMAVLLPGVAAGAEATPSALAQLEEAFTSVAERASAAVVVITNKQVERRPQGRQLGELPPELRYFFGLPQDDEGGPADPRGPQVPVPAGRGSGLIIRPDGYIVTNYHVIEDADALEVKLHDGRVFDSGRDAEEVVVIGSDRDTDLAVLRIGKGKLKDLPTLPFADSSKVKPGQFAIAVGAPFNFDYSVSVGHVSQKGRHGVRMNHYENYIQTDASINPGNSGGPLLNLKGEVLGINEFIVTGGAFSRGSVGIGFAIASNLVRQVADSLIENKGVVVRPWLGIAMQPLTEELKSKFKVASGVLINDVIAGDPAAQAGLKPGDVVLKVGDTEVNEPHDVQFAVLGYKPGEKIPLQIDRGGQKLTIDVVARQKGDGDRTAAQPAAELAPGKLGLALEETAEGVKVIGVNPGSAASAAQLRRDDLILEVNRKPVKTVADVQAALQGSTDGIAVLYVSRRGAKFFVPIATGDDKK